MDGLLYRLEEERDRTAAQQMQEKVQAALDAFRPMCADCGLAMSRHSAYPRSIITKDGELKLSIPKFRCGECGRMTSGVELLGDERRGRHSKKPRRRR